MPESKNATSHLIDEAAIRDVIARFADTGIRGDYDGFRSLWAPDAIWDIPKPVSVRAEGVDEIIAMLHKMRDDKTYFVQFSLPGPIKIDGDLASTRTVTHEAASGPNGVYYRNYGIFFDRLRRSDDGWVFVERLYNFLWLDTSPFSGDSFKLSGG